jgi:hypothetical protein
VTVTSGVPSSVYSQVTGLTSGLQAGATTTFTVELVDAFDNVATDEGTRLVGIAVVHSSGYTPTVAAALTTAGSGTLGCEYRAIRAGDYTLTVSFTDSEPITQSISWVYADAPRLSHAIIMKNGQGVQLAFNTRTDGGGVTGQFACEEVLSTASALGSGALCQWTKADFLTAKFGATASRTVLPYADVSVLDDTIGQAGLDSLKSTGSTQLLPPCGMGPADCTLEEPLLSVPHPLFIGECDDFMLDASGSKDPALGSPTFSYAVDWNAPNAVAINAELLSEATAFASITNTLLQGDTNYTFTVRMTNSYNQEVSYTGWFYKTGLPVPKIIVSGDSTQDVDYRENKFLQADATLSECPGASASLDFAWSSEADGLVLNEKTAGTRRLYIEKNTLAPPDQDFDGLYTFDLIGADSTNPTAFGTTQVKLQVLSSPVRAVIKGGDRVASQLQDFVLDGTDSTDPDDASQESSEFVYSWSCAAEDGSSCYENEATGFAAGEQLGGGTFSDGGGLVTIEQGTLKLGTLIFTLDVMKTPGPRLDTTAVSVTMVSGQVPNVAITAAERSYVLPSDTLYIFATAEGSPDGNGELTYQWYEEAPENGGSGLSLSSLTNLPLGHSGTLTAESNSAHLVVGPDQLTGGQTYIFSLEVTEQTAAGTNVAVSRQELFVNDAPSGGETTLSPTQGFKMQTVYSVRFEGWLDDQRPLAYSVSSIDADLKEAFLMTPQRSNTLTFKLPDAGTLTLATDVYDAYGSSTRSVFEVINDEAVYGDDAAAADMAVAMGTGDFAALSQIASAFTAGRRRRLAEGDACVTCDLVDSVHTQLQSSVLTQADVAQYLSTISDLAEADISTSSRASETNTRLQSAYSTVVDAARDLGMSIATATSVVEVAHKLSGVIIGDGCSSDVTTTRVEPLRGAMEDIVHGMLLGTLADEAAKIVHSASADTESENRISVRGQRSTAEGQEGTFISDPGAVSTVRVEYADIRKVLLSTSKHFDLLHGIVGQALVCDESSILSSVHTIALYDPDSSSPRTALSVSDPASLTVSVGALSASHYAICQQLGSSGWTADGVTTQSYDSGTATVVCELQAINGAVMANVAQQAWSECTTGEQFQFAAPTDTANRVCQALSTCDSVSEFESTEATETSDRECSPLSECDTNAIIAVPATTTSDRTCQCAGEFFGTGLECTAWTVCGQNANTIVEGSSTADRQCACDNGHWEQNRGEGGGDCAPWTTCDEGHHETVEPTLFNDRECEPNTCTMPTTAPTGYVIDSFACSDRATGSIVCETPATCIAGFFTTTAVSYSCPADGGELALAGCSECEAVSNAATDATVTCSTSTNSRVSECAVGFFKDGTGDADVCTPCEVVANAATDATYTCSSAADSRVSSCGDDHFKVGSGTADVCTACATCASGQFTSEECSATSDAQCTSCETIEHAIDGATYTCESASDSRVSACAAGYERVPGGDQLADTCAPISGKCGGNAEGAGDYTCPQRYHSLADQVTINSVACVDETCTTEEATRRTEECCAEDCPTPSSTDAELCCTPVDFALSGTQYTCTGATDSRIGECAAGYFRNSAAVADACTTCTPVENAAVDASYTCTTSSDSRTDSCGAGYYKDSAESADICTPCTPVASAAEGAAYTCDTATTSRVSACAAGSYRDSSAEADVCTPCVSVLDALEGSPVTCSTGSDSRIDSCAAGFFKDGTGDADVCTPCEEVANVAANATYTCSSAADSRVSSCGDGHFKVGSGTADVCTPWTTCGANAETQQEGTTTEDRVCVCSDGFFSSTHAGGAFEDCVAWSACEEGLEVSIAGTTSSDQVCGLKLVASAVVPMAISDVDAFKAQIASESGSADAVVQITNFEQQVTSAATLPGSASEYESADAKTQFRTGVATALGVDLAAVSEITVTAGTGRRLLDSHSSGGEARRLQDSVSISYVVTVTDITLAAQVAAATQDTGTFAGTLVAAVNDQRPADDQIDPTQVTVEAPAITTEIEYEVAVTTSDTSVIASVQAQLGQASVIAQALTNMGITVDASDLTVVATVACSRPTVQGYLYTEASVLPGVGFDVSVTCAAGYEGSPVATTCDDGPGAYSVIGCTEIVCTQPTDLTGYAVTDTQLNVATGFDVTAQCADGGYWEGTAAAVACTASGPYTLSGCAPCDASQCAMCVTVTRSTAVCESWGVDCTCFRSRANTCTVPTDVTGVEVTGLSCSSTTSGAVDCTSATCAEGYAGTPVPTCPLLPAGPNPPLSLDGCVENPPPPPPDESTTDDAEADGGTQRVADVESDADSDLTDEYGSLIVYAIGFVAALAACLLLCGVARCGIWFCAHPDGPNPKRGKNSVAPEPPRLRPAPPHARRTPRNSTTPGGGGRRTPGGGGGGTSPMPPQSPNDGALPPLRLRGRELRVAATSTGPQPLPSLQRNPARPRPPPP